MKKTIGIIALTVAGIFSTVCSDAKTVYNFPFAPQTGIVNEVEKPFRQEVCLNGYWDFQPVKTPANYIQGSGKAPELPEPAKGEWSATKIKIPSPWNINSFAYRDLEGPDHRNYPSYPKEWDDILMGWLKKNGKSPFRLERGRHHPLFRGSGRRGSDLRQRTFRR